MPAALITLSTERVVTRCTTAFWITAVGSFSAVRPGSRNLGQQRACLKFRILSSTLPTRVRRVNAGSLRGEFWKGERDRGALVASIWIRWVVRTSSQFEQSMGAPLGRPSTFGSSLPIAHCRA